MTFNPTRLSVARKRRMLNKKDLAKALAVNPHTIILWEKGSTVPNQHNVEQLALVLGYPVGFFYDGQMVEPDSALTSFRSQTAMSAAQRDAALAAGSIGFLIADWVERQFDLPPVNVPDLHLDSDPETASRTLREEWKLGEKPISNMIQLLESKGVRVFSLAENTVTVNAYSLWRNGKPYVFLNTFKSAECSRLDAAHELAHLVLHQDGSVTGREAEDQANTFASAFLMPRADVIASVPRIARLDQAIAKKQRWRVSVAAFNYRLHKLRLITDWKYRDFCIEIARRGYRTSEPHSIEREKSVVWEKVLKMLWTEKITPSDIATQLNIPVSELSDLIFGMLGSPGTPSGQPALTLVPPGEPEPNVVA